MKNKKHLQIGAIVGTVALFVGVLATQTDYFQGAFNFNNSPGKNTQQNIGNGGNNGGRGNSSPNFGGGGNQSVEPLMMIYEDAGLGSVHEGYETIGAWFIEYADDATPCYDFDFTLVDASDGQYDLDEVFEDTRLNVSIGDIDLYTQVEDGDYLSPGNNLSGFSAQGSGLASGEARLFQLYGKYKDSYSLGSHDEEHYVYFSETCVFDADKDQQTWSSSTPHGDNDYFETDDYDTGYGVSGGVWIGQ